MSVTTPVNISVTSPYKKDAFKISITNAESLNSIKQYLISLGQIQQPITCFNLYHGDTKLDTFATIEELGFEQDVELKLVPEDYTLGEVNAHIQQTREMLGFVSDSSPVSVINAGPIAINKFNVKKQPKKGERALTDKPDLPEDMPVLHYDFEANPAVLASKRNTSLPTPVARTLHFSCWQPPTFANKLKGHLAYLKFVAEDHKVFHITATTKGFFVNSSTDDKFDESPKKDGAHHVSLLHLIGKVSPRTLNAVERMNNKLAKISPQIWTLPRSSYLDTPWLVDTTPAAQAPVADLARTQSLFANEQASLKDWNEDYQTTRELPKFDENGSVTVRDRIIREKLLVNTAHDFATAATKGALDILSGNMQAFNPNEPAENQIYLRNGIFYTLGFDSVGNFASVGGDEAARVAALKDLRGVEQIMTLDLDNITPVLTAVIDFCGRRIIAQGPVPGIFRENVEPQIVYGSAEGYSDIFASESVEPDMQKIANAFHLKKHTAFDLEGKTAELVTSVDMKCMNGSDGRKYVLDCARVSPVDIGYLSEHSEYPHQYALLRPEAVASWVRHKVREDLEKQQKEATSEEEIKLDDAKVAEYQAMFVVNPDVSVLTPPENLKKEYEQDSKVVLEVSQFIKDIVIPGYIKDIANSDTVYPIDGSQLTEGMHRRGVSMRHLGYMYSSASKEPNCDALCDVIIREAISRAAKHLVNRETCSLDFTAVHGAILGFLQGIESNANLKSEVRVRFGFEVDVAKYLDRQLLREIALKLNLQLSASALQDKAVAWNKLNVNDLVGFAPKIRYATIQSAIPEEALNAGRVSVQNNKEEGLEIIRESLSLHEQVYGSIHPETAKAYNQVSLVYHEFQDYNTAAELCRKAIGISERVNGVDSTETIVMYINLGFYERARGNFESSLELHKHVLDLWTGIGSKDHPDMLNTVQSIATMLFQTRFYKESITWFNRAIELAEKYDSKSAAPLYLQVSQAHVILNNAYADATRCAEKAFALYKTHRGPEDENTKESKKWLDQLVNATVRDLKAQKLPKVTVNAPSLKQKKEPKSRNVNDIVDYIVGDEKTKKKGKKDKKDKKKK